MYPNLSAVGVQFDLGYGLRRVQTKNDPRRLPSPQDVDVLLGEPWTDEGGS